MSENGQKKMGGAGAGRRHRRRAGVAGPGQLRLQGLSRRARGGHRRHDVPPRQDLPDRRLRHLHRVAQARRVRPQPQHRNPDAVRADGPRGRAGQLQGHRQAVSAVRGRDQVQRLQRVHQCLSRADPGPFRPRAGQAQGHRQALRPGDAEHLRHPQERPLALQGGLPGERQRAGLRPAHQEEGIRQGREPDPGAQPAVGDLRPGLHPSLRERVHARQGR